ncbi:hypothetical protein ACA910_019543 [Epithemia clementina (nom. ined.)]
MSACSSCYTDESVIAPSVATDTYAYSSGPALQAWSSPVPVPTIVETTTLGTSPSPISQEALDKVTTENAWLNQELQEMHKQLSNLIKTQQLQAQKIHPPPPPVHYSSIVSAAIETLVTTNLLQVHTLQATPFVGNLPSNLPADNQATTASCMDVSFAGSLSRIDHDEPE